MFSGTANLADAGSPADPIENPVWTVGDFFLITLAAIAFLFIFVIVIALIAVTLVPSYRVMSSEELSSNIVLGVIAQATSYAAIAVLTARVIRRRATSLHRYLTFFGAMRWNAPRSKAKFAIVGVLLALIFSVTQRFLPIPPDLPIEQAFRTVASAYITSLFGIAIAPLCEEIYFRGLMYPILVRAFRRFGATVAVSIAVTITAACFTVLHAVQLSFSWAPLLVIFFVGLILTLVRAQTRSLAASWLVHICYNTTLLAITFVQTGGFRHMT